MAKVSPKLIQNVFEARFKHGYRYLDRCGDAMILLEKGLPEITDNMVWMPEGMAPTGAHMKCPELDITLLFDSLRLCVDQNPADVKCPFEAISTYAFNTLVSKFDIQKIARFGKREFYLLATDSIEDAESLSLKKVPFDNWLKPESKDIKPKSCDIAYMLENEDRSKGIRFSIGSTFKVEAPLKLDDRLKRPPHTLEKDQRHALISQLKRQKQRLDAPIAGLLIDIDCWWLNPEENNINAFFEFSTKQIKKLLESLLDKKK